MTEKIDWGGGVPNTDFSHWLWHSAAILNFEERTWPRYKT